MYYVTYNNTITHMHVNQKRKVKQEKQSKTHNKAELTELY